LASFRRYAGARRRPRALGSFGEGAPSVVPPISPTHSPQTAVGFVSPRRAAVAGFVRGMCGAGSGRPDSCRKAPRAPLASFRRGAPRPERWGRSGKRPSRKGGRLPRPRISRPPSGSFRHGVPLPRLGSFGEPVPAPRVTVGSFGEARSPLPPLVTRHPPPAPGFVRGNGPAGDRRRRSYPRAPGLPLASLRHRARQTPRGGLASFRRERDGVAGGRVGFVSPTEWGARRGWNWLRFVNIVTVGSGDPRRTEAGGFVRGGGVSSPATRHPPPATRGWLRFVSITAVGSGDGLASFRRGPGAQRHTRTWLRVATGWSGSRDDHGRLRFDSDEDGRRTVRRPGARLLIGARRSVDQDRPCRATYPAAGRGPA
jgi:hypothetical protein